MLTTDQRHEIDAAFSRLTLARQANDYDAADLCQRELAKLGVRVVFSRRRGATGPAGPAAIPYRPEQDPPLPGRRQPIELLGVAEAAKVAFGKPSVLRGWVAEGWLPHYVTGRGPLFEQESLLAAVCKRACEGGLKR